MPIETIPLVGEYNQRQQLDLPGATSGLKDHRFINCVINQVNNHQTQTKTLYLEKRHGFYTKGSISGGVIVNLYKTNRLGGRFIYSLYTGSEHHLYYGSTSAPVYCGQLYGEAAGLSEGFISNTHYFFIRGSGGSPYGGWYLASDAATAGSVTFTANTTSGSPVLTNVSSVSNLHVGQHLSGTGLVVGQDTRILSIDSGASTVTMTENATANGTGITVTFERVALIIDADFPTTITGEFVVMDGYVSVADTSTRRIYTSDLNNPDSWGASSYLTFGVNADTPIGLFKYKGYMGCFGSSSTEFFTNAGNATGSPFSRADQLTNRVGCLGYTGASARPYASVGDSIFWLGGPGGQGISVYTFDGFSPVSISSDNLNRHLTGKATFNLSAFRLANGINVLLSGESTTEQTYRKFVINTEIKTETEWELGTNAVLSVVGGLASGEGSTDEGVYACDSVTDNIYQLLPDYYLDDGNSFTLTLQSSKINLGTDKRKFYTVVYLIGSDIQSSGSATLEYSDDDYATWTTAGNFDLSEPNPKIHRCGSHVGGRAWRLTHSSNTAFRAQALEFDYEVGTH